MHLSHLSRRTSSPAVFAHWSPSQHAFTLPDPSYLVSLFRDYLGNPTASSENIFRQAFGYFERASSSELYVQQLGCSRDASLFEAVLQRSFEGILVSITGSLSSASTVASGASSLRSTKSELASNSLCSLKSGLRSLLALSEFLPSISPSYQIYVLSQWVQFMSSPEGIELINVVYDTRFGVFLRRFSVDRRRCVHLLSRIADVMLQTVVFLMVKEIHLPHSESCYIKDIQVLLIDCLKCLPAVWGIDVKNVGMISSKLLRHEFFDVMLAFLIDKLNSTDTIWLLQVLYANHAELKCCWLPDELLKRASKTLGKQSRRVLKKKRDQLPNFQAFAPAVAV